MPRGDLKNLKREDLEPLWTRLDIKIQSIADALGVTRQAVSYQAAKMGLPSRYGNQTPSKKCSDDVFKRMWLAGVVISDIGTHCGYSQNQSVQQRRRHMGLPPREKTLTARLAAGKPSISLADFAEMELARLMKDAA